jgi:hypothetical protein
MSTSLPASLFMRRCGAAFALLVCSAAHGEIPKPDDAPQPLSPAESAKLFQVPAGVIKSACWPANR